MPNGQLKQFTVINNNYFDTPASVMLKVFNLGGPTIMVMHDFDKAQHVHIIIEQ